MTPSLWLPARPTGIDSPKRSRNSNSARWLPRPCFRRSTLSRCFTSSSRGSPRATASGSTAPFSSSTMRPTALCASPSPSVRRAWKRPTRFGMRWSARSLPWPIPWFAIRPIAPIRRRMSSPGAWPALRSAAAP